jgi:hypothetical protein
VGLLFLALPLAWIIFWGEKKGRSHKDPVPWLNFSWSPSAWLLGSLFALGIALRLFKLTTLSVWPIWDDAANSYFAIGQWEHWRWQLWNTWEQSPPLSMWAQSLFFRLVPPSLFSMWFWPALQSIINLFLGYWACRQFGSRLFSFFFLFFLAIGFWPIYLGKFCIPAELCLLWLLLCLGLLGSFLNCLKKQFSLGKALGLGLCVGSGFYIWIITCPSILFICLVVLWILLRNPLKHWKELLAFCLPVLLAALPVSDGILTNIRQGHLHQYLQVGGKNMDFFHQVGVSLSYLTVFLWGPMDKSYFCFGPLWGGFLNPLLGSAFLLGLAECVRFRKEPAVMGACCALILNLLPGLLSTNQEMFRICLAMPFVLLLAALGLQKLCSNIFNRGTLILALVLLTGGSLILDLYHFMGPYHQWATPGPDNAFSKSPERFRAFPVLKREADRVGPGLVLTEFVPNVFDQSLLITAYPFNAARNPALDPHQARWAGILATCSQQAYLAKRFPSARWYKLSTDIQRYDDALFLGIISLSPSSIGSFSPWVKLNLLLQSFYPLIPYGETNPDYAPILSKLLENYAEFKRDPFLEACLREKIADFEFSSGHMDRFLKIVGPLLSSDFSFSLLYRRQGVAFLTLGFPQKAREAFEIGTRLNPLNAPPLEILRELKQIRK